LEFEERRTWQLETSADRGRAADGRGAAVAGAARPAAVRPKLRGAGAI